MTITPDNIPPVLPVEPDQFKDVPETMKAVPNWIVWKRVVKTKPDGTKKVDKVPYVARNPDRLARTTDPGDMNEYKVARAAYRNDKKQDFYGIAGIGFVFNDNGDCGVDLDNAYDPVHNTIVPEYIEIVKAFKDTYIEISPSMRGLHILLYCEENPYPQGWSCQWKTDTGEKREVGFFSSEKYFTVTGNRLTIPCRNGRDLNEYHEDEIRTILKTWYEKRKTHKKPPQVGAVSAAQVLADSDVISIASKARYRRDFSSLYSGKWEGAYPSQSEADLALASKIAFYTQDEGQVIRLMRGSGLHREKWDKRPEYLRETIRMAIHGLSNVYVPATVRGQKVAMELMKWMK